MFNVTYGCDLCPKQAQTGMGRTLHALLRHRAWMTGHTIELRFNREWGDLARFNADRSAFDEKHAAAMRAKQERYNREVLGLAPKQDSDA